MFLGSRSFRIETRSYILHIILNSKNKFVFFSYIRCRNQFTPLRAYVHTLHAYIRACMRAYVRTYIIKKHRFYFFWAGYRGPAHTLHWDRLTCLRGCQRSGPPAGCSMLWARGTTLTILTNTLLYTAWHYITLPYTALFYIALNSITLHFVTLHLHCTTITLHYTALHYIVLNSTTMQVIGLRYITLH